MSWIITAASYSKKSCHKDRKWRSEYPWCCVLLLLLLHSIRKEIKEHKTKFINSYSQSLSILIILFHALYNPCPIVAYMVNSKSISVWKSFITMVEIIKGISNNSSRSVFFHSERLCQFAFHSSLPFLLHAWLFKSTFCLPLSTSSRLHEVTHLISAMRNM